MMLGGDEFRRSQQGNNNAYCQDSEISWVDWPLLERNSEVFQFARGVLAFRRAHPVLRREAFYTDEEVSWFDPDGKTPDWFDPRQKRLACLIRSQGASDLYLMFNAGSEGVAFVLPPCSSYSWRLAVDTAGPLPPDFYRAGEEAALTNPMSYLVQARSCAILVAH
jgi:glycogen operon protein